MHARHFVGWVWIVGSAALFTAAPACGSDGRTTPEDLDPTGDAASPSPTTPPLVPDGSIEGGPAPKPCTGLCLQQVTCEAGKTTSVTGRVFDPAGKVPLYNVLVYVPNAELGAIKTGASCDRCGSVSGDPLVSTLTDANGSFTLPNMPVGKDIPVVVQIGKWRRKVIVPETKKCEDVAFTDTETFRLPKKKSEGDMPQMAIASGSADPFECLLTKMGIDVSEITSPVGPGRVHFYRSNGADTNPPTAGANTLWNDLEVLKKYDLVMLPCEGQANAHAGPDTLMMRYANLGGRVFTTHYGFSWLHLGNRNFEATGTWAPDKVNSGATTRDFQVDTSFPKGKAFADWLKNVNATPTSGTLPVTEWRHDLDAEKNPPSQRWVYGPTTAGPSVQHMTFNTPITAAEDKKCGRVVFSDFHVSANALTTVSTFPGSCKTGDLSGQEKALEFMFFDLASCIQNDAEPPRPPPVIR